MKNVVSAFDSGREAADRRQQSPSSSSSLVTANASTVRKGTSGLGYGRKILQGIYCRKRVGNRGTKISVSQNEARSWISRHHRARQYPSPYHKPTRNFGALPNIPSLAALALRPLPQSRPCVAEWLGSIVGAWRG